MEKPETIEIQAPTMLGVLPEELIGKDVDGTPTQEKFTRITSADLEASECINLISAALAKAQGTIVAAGKSGYNPHFKSKYSELSDVWDACRKSLSDNGLSVVQMPQSKGGEVRLTTILSHSSGQWFKSSLTSISAKNTPQGVGSVITYLRRYALSSMVGVASDDDDGNEATQPANNNSGDGYHKQQEKSPIQYLMEAIGESDGIWSMPDCQRYFKGKYGSNWPPTDLGQWRHVVAVVKSKVDPAEVVK